MCPKTQRQQHYTGVIQGLMKIKREEGLKGFWRGNGANVYKIIPEVSLIVIVLRYLTLLSVRYSIHVMGGI